MPLSYQSITNPSSTSFTVSFEFLNLADIKAVGKLNSASEWTELPVTDAATSNDVTTVTVADAGTYSSAGEVRIYRATSQAPLVDFQNGSRLSESDLDTAYRQGLFAAQEVRENAADTVTAVGPQGPAGADGSDGQDGQDGQDGTDGTSASNTPRFSVKKNQDQTGITDNQFTQVTFETEEFDSEGAFASNRFTVPTGKGGIYSIGFNFVGGRNNNTKHVEAFINLNGSTNIAAGITDLNSTPNGYAMPIHLTRLVTLNEGDYIEFYAQVDTQDSGTATFYQTYSSAVACYAYGFKLA
jgi:hypothetical protein